MNERITVLATRRMHATHYYSEGFRDFINYSGVIEIREISNHLRFIKKR